MVVVGGANNDQKGTTEGEGVDRASLTLAGEQMALVERAANASVTHGVPLVVVLVDGKPTAEPALTEESTWCAARGVPGRPGGRCRRRFRHRWPLQSVR